jgi:hypothetical protein
MSHIQVEPVADYTMAGPDPAHRSSATWRPIVAAHLHGISWFPSRTSAIVGERQWDWDRVHEAIQRSLGRLVDSVRSEEPASRWKCGRTATKAFPLFSYLVFYHLDGGDFDPVVVGITLKPGSELIRITGDISGDESGHVYFDEGCEIEVPLSLEASLRGAVEVADRLAAQRHVVLEALRERIPQAIER